MINQVIHGQTLDQETNQQPGPEFHMTNQYQCLASYLNGGTSILDLNNFKLNGRAEEGGRRQPIAVPDYKASEPRVDSLHQKLTNLLADTSEDCNIKDIIVHGSYGDGRITYYSDIDLTVVLDEGVFDSSETIFRYAFYLRRELPIGSYARLLVTMILILNFGDLLQSWVAGHSLEDILWQRGWQFGILLALKLQAPNELGFDFSEEVNSDLPDHSAA